MPRRSATAFDFFLSVLPDTLRLLTWCRILFIVLTRGIPIRVKGHTLLPGESAGFNMATPDPGDRVRGAW